MSPSIMLLSPDDGQLEKLRGWVREDIEIGWVDSTGSLDQQASQLSDAVVIIAIPSEITRELVLACPNLRLVQVISAGTNRIDVQGLGELGIRVANNGGGNSVAVSEHAITLMVGVFRNLHLQLQAAKTGQWQGDIREIWGSTSQELSGKTVGIVGMGRIGRQVARRLQGWDCDIIYHDVLDIPSSLEEQLHLTRVSLDDLLSRSDVVTLHVPLTKRTTSMISAREFRLMKPTAVIINTCRGPVVDESAMIQALEEGKISGAGLDVLEQEPTALDNPLLNMENVLVTPHLAALPEDSRDKSRAFAVENAMRVTKGVGAQSVVLPD